MQSRCRCDETENIALRDEKTNKKSIEFYNAVDKLNAAHLSHEMSKNYLGGRKTFEGM